MAEGKIDLNILKIVQLDSSYKGKSAVFYYTTDGYYDLSLQYNKNEVVAELKQKKLAENRTIKFEAIWMEAHFEEPQLFAAINDDEVVGYLEIAFENWNNRIRITNIFVCDGARRLGVGHLLMNKAKKIARHYERRAIVLETQSCNIAAINFYHANGFKVIGFDAIHYSNNDIEEKEVRIEMGYILS